MKHPLITDPAEIARFVPGALREARKEAHRLARAYGTRLWVMKKGKVVGLKP